MAEREAGPDRLRAAVRAALEAADEAGRLEGGARSELESTLAALDDRLGADRTGVHFAVESLPDCCVVTMGGSAPVAMEVAAAFMERAGARRLGTSKAWLLDLGGVPVTRWARALRRVVTAERRGREGAAELPIRLTFAWPAGGELAVASVE